MRAAAVCCEASKPWSVVIAFSVSHHRLYNVLLLEFLNLGLVVTKARQNRDVVLSQFRGNADFCRGLGELPRRAVYFELFPILRIFHLSNIAIGEDIGVIGGFK